MKESFGTARALSALGGQLRSALKALKTAADKVVKRMTLRIILHISPHAPRQVLRSPEPRGASERGLFDMDRQEDPCLTNPLLTIFLTIPSVVKSLENTDKANPWRH